MTLLLDTHFLIWLVLGSKRIGEFPWLAKYAPWGVSPVCLLEIQFLSEVGKLRVTNPNFVDTLEKDPRFVLDEVPLLPLMRHALPLAWSRDPFDRLLCAHSSARRVPLCSLDATIRKHHPLLAREVMR